VFFFDYDLDGWIDLFAANGHIDEEIGRVLSFLQERGDLENTIVVYLADHGDFAGEHGLFHKNFGLYESIVRIPLLLAWPGGPQGVVRDGLVESIDIYPTLCELADVPVPGEVEGASLLPVAAGGNPGKEESLCEWDHFGLGHRVHSLRTPRYRIVYYDRAHGGELYDHERDPGEVENLWDSPEHLPVRVALMERLLDRVAEYRPKTCFAYDREQVRQTRVTPTTLLHKRRRNWKEIVGFYEG
jgi:arylsulfatase A-like enzyme